MQLDLNGHYCLANKLHYEKFVEDNMRDCFLYVKHFEVNDVFIVENGKAYLEDISSAEGLIPMHIHNNEWVEGSLEPTVMLKGSYPAKSGDTLIITRTGVEVMQLDLNGHYCLATKEHYDKLVGDGYKDYLYTTSSLNCEYLFIIDNKILCSNTISDEQPMYLHNNEWCFGSLEHEVYGVPLSEIEKSVIEYSKPKPLGALYKAKSTNNRWYYSDDEAYALRDIKGKLFLIEMENFYNNKNIEESIIGEAIPCDEPKPVERITREEALQMKYLEQTWNIDGEELICFSTFNKCINKLFDYIEYLEANQKATK